MRQKVTENLINRLMAFFLGLGRGLGGSEVKASASNAGDPGSIPGSGRSPGEANGNPLQYSCLENPMDRGAWWATVHRVTKSWTQLKRYSVAENEERAIPLSEGCHEV